MLKLTNIRIGVRLGAAFGVVLALMAAMLAVGVMELSRIDTDKEAMRAAAYRHQLAQQWLGAIASNAVRTYAKVRAAEPADAAFFDNAMKSVSARITAIQDELAPLITTDEGKRQFAAVGTARKTYAAARDAAFAARRRRGSPPARWSMRSSATRWCRP